jgi:hypothetical protein
LFDLHNEPTYARMVAKGNLRAALDEYLVLYCALFYLSCCNLAFKELVYDNLEPEQQELIAPLLNSYTLVEEWLRKRLALIRIIHNPDLNPQGGPEFCDFMRGEIYQKSDVSALGSTELAAMAERFSVAKGKATLAVAAKRTAESKFPRTGPKNSTGADHSKSSKTPMRLKSAHTDKSTPWKKSAHKTDETSQ